VDDLGEICVFALERWQAGPEDPPLLNVGIGMDLTIGALSETVAEATGYEGTILWDISKPDGTPRKQLDVSPLAALGWRARIPLAQGLASTVAGFREQLSQQLVRLLTPAMHWTRCGSWRRCGSCGSPQKHGSTRRAPVSCTVQCRRSCRWRARSSGRVASTGWR